MIKIIIPGKINLGFIGEGVDYYYKKINKFLKINLIHTKTPDSYTSRKEKLRKEKNEIEKHIENSYLIVLDEKGKEYSSIELSKKFEFLIQSNKDISFVIGGDEGVDEDIKKKADELLSLSKNTFTHELSLLVLMEVIYRSLMISKNYPYHK